MNENKTIQTFINVVISFKGKRKLNPKKIDKIKGKKGIKWKLLRLKRKSTIIIIKQCDKG